MPDTRFSLIGKACVWIVRATDSELRGMLAHGGWKGLKKSEYLKLIPFSELNIYGFETN